MQPTELLIKRGRGATEPLTPELKQKRYAMAERTWQRNGYHNRPEWLCQRCNGTNSTSLAKGNKIPAAAVDGIKDGCSTIHKPPVRLNLQSSSRQHIVERIRFDTYNECSWRCGHRATHNHQCKTPCSSSRCSRTRSKTKQMARTKKKTTQVGAHDLVQSSSRRHHQRQTSSRIRIDLEAQQPAKPLFHRSKANSQNGFCS